MSVSVLVMFTTFLSATSVAQAQMPPESGPGARHVRGPDGRANAQVWNSDGKLRDHGHDGVVESRRVTWTQTGPIPEEIQPVGRVCVTNADGTAEHWDIEHGRAISTYTGPPDPDDPNTPPPAQNEVVNYVKHYFRQIDIPKPQPEISAQNGGICGVEHTVDLHMEPELLFREGQTPFGDLNFHVYGEITVNWGDGHSDVYRTGGGPYPNSAIRHVWSNKGFYDITATATWTADFTLGPYQGFTYSGTLAGITTQGAIADFRVWDVQAVLTS